MKLKFEFVLGSESPRRKQLLEATGFNITVFPVKVSEILEKNLNVQAQIQAISLRKWQATRDEWVRTKGPESVLLTADTMVVFAGQALGKPQDWQAAFETLSRLSGQAHQVMTAVTLGLTSSPTPLEEIVTTDVLFRLISKQEIEDYIQTGEPMDKAGSYAIQGLGGKFVEKFVGDYDNVVGLPTSLVRELIVRNGWADDLR